MRETRFTNVATKRRANFRVFSDSAKERAVLCNMRNVTERDIKLLIEMAITKKKTKDRGKKEKHVKNLTFIFL